MNRTKAAAFAVLVLCASSALAGPTPADKCEASKSKTAGAYYACRQKAEATAIVKAAAPDYGKCTSKFEEKWDGAEVAGGGACPDDALTGPMNAYLSAQASAAAAIIAGTANTPVCGDGLINAVGEHCDGGSLSGYSCLDFDYRQGTLACTENCEFDTSGCSMCQGLLYAGACWHRSEGLSCDTTCAARGELYDSATATIAGSGGTDEACDVLLDAWGILPTGLDFTGACGSGYGCYEVIGEFAERGRCTSPETTSSASAFDIDRICACVSKSR